MANNLPVRVREDLADDPRSRPSAASESESVNCSSPPNSCTHASAARTSGDSAADPSSESPPTDREIRFRLEADTHSDTLSIGGDSAADPSSENPPTEVSSRSTEVDIDVAPNVDVCISGGDSAQSTAANPVTDGETNFTPVGVRDTRDMRSETGESASSEEESPIRNIRG